LLNGIVSLLLLDYLRLCALLYSCLGLLLLESLLLLLCCYGFFFLLLLVFSH
jgi:hypothetical protein